MAVFNNPKNPPKIKAAYGTAKKARATLKQHEKRRGKLQEQCIIVQSYISIKRPV